MHANIGRPSGYSQDVADQLCAAIAEGHSLRTVCKRDDMPSIAAVFRWLGTFEPFREQYARAGQERCEAFAEDIIALADEPVAPNDNAAVQRARLRVDTRKWLMSKLAPRKYGDRVEHVIKSGNAADLTDDELARIAMAAAPALLLTAAPVEENYPEPTQHTEAKDKA
jgi:hypothetical protein